MVSRRCAGISLYLKTVTGTVKLSMYLKSRSLCKEKSFCNQERSKTMQRCQMLLSATIHEELTRCKKYFFNYFCTESTTKQEDVHSVIVMLCSFQDKDFKVSWDTCAVLAPYFILFDCKYLSEMQEVTCMFEY